MDDQTDSDDTLPEGYGELDRAAMIATLRALPKRWKVTDKSLGLSPKDWRPALRSGSKDILHLHTVPELAKPWIERMVLARAAGYRITVAAPEEMWRAVRTLVTVDSVGAQPALLRFEAGSNQWFAAQHASVVEMIVAAKLLLDRTTRLGLGLGALERALAANSSGLKGRLFESFLRFLFSQVPCLELFESNYTNTTEEIDIVLRNRQSSTGALPRSPLVLLSAKNEKNPVGVPAVTSLEAKIRNRRGQCALGFLCCSRKFAATVSQHLLRSSRENHVIATLDGSDLKDLLGAADIESDLEAIVTKAALS